METNIWLILLCVAVALGIGIIGVRNIRMKRQRKVSNAQIRCFVDTAYDIRTPLTLVKSPLEEIAEKESLSEEGRKNLETALRNVDELLKLANHMTDIGHAGNGCGQAMQDDMPANDVLAPQASTAEEADDGTTQERILIVEGNDELREYLRRMLSANYQVQVCQSGETAIDIVKTYFPDLVITDILMPGMHGDELCRRLKNDVETSHIPIILLTALDSDRQIIEGLQSGADEYIVKPFNMEVLRAIIANLLANRVLLRRKYAHIALDDNRQEGTCINCMNDLDWKFIATVRQHVEQNLSTPNFNVDTLCALLGMSRSSFYNKIKALTGQAPADYVRLIRLNRAAHLLREQQHNVTEVSDLTGFSDAKYFREVFKKHFKVSPSQYAKQGNSGEGHPQASTNNTPS